MQKDTGRVLSWIGLSSVPGVGRSTFRKLVAHFGSPERVLSARPNAFKEIAGLSDKVIKALVSFAWREPAEQELARATEADVVIITVDQPEYPDSLRTIPDPPLYLYVKGSLKPQDVHAIALVGTRKPTQYGRSITYRISSDLARAGFTIVSGLARGIDTQAHRGALSAGGRTIGVLGCGVDIAYPPENKELLAEISQNGAIVTEYPFGAGPEAGYFPARNRIISGLSRGTVIIEAAEDSGSLITAKNALQQNRKLFAVPGNIGSATSRGPNNLIKQGAALIESADDILKYLGRQTPNSRETSQSEPSPVLSQDEKRIYQCITDEPKHIDTLLIESRSSAGKLSGVLINLELKGLAKQLPGKYFIREE
jgi:DNA processing protein